MELPKAYSPVEEKKTYQFWAENSFFQPKTSERGIFSLVIPPPNVTGVLHMGHALDTTIQDILIRWQRMKRKETLWLPGTDHAGIATQNVVEKELAKSGQFRKNMSRQDFVQKVWEWKEKYGGIILEQLKRLGASCDWSRTRFTMDEGCSAAVREVFVALYEQGLIYQGYYIVNWCPRCHTAISDIEVDFITKKSQLYYLRYPLKEKIKNSDGTFLEYLVVATTRPETMLGDTAVAVNPHDARYKNLIGQKIILPLLNREIPIIADEAVEPNFGTGAVKVTPAHDPDDYLIGKRHNLEEINIFDISAVLNEKAGKYQGLSREKAREKVLKDLKALELIEKIEDYEHSVGQCYRCKTIIEPCLSKQWFVKVRPLAEPAIEAVKSGQIKFFPEHWAKVYLDWMGNLRDWCISRQLYWGHRIPVWYCADCQQQGRPGVIVSRTDPAVCPDCGNKNLKQDEDVLDTWFSSALWPFSTLGWPAQTEDLKKYYPTSVLVTGYDIITFWVSKMIMMGLKFMKDVPFRVVYIHGLVRDSHGKKMSKSSGNVIDPIPLIEDVGADALRFALASLVTAQGQDLKLTPDKITESRNFANKLWNASRYVLSVVKPQTKVPLDFKTFTISKKLNLADQWILSRWHRTIAEFSRLMENFYFGEAARLIYEFIWNEFCDWYLEISKIEEKKGNAAVGGILIYILEGALRLLHPFMPFITENIWQKIKEYFQFKKPVSIMIDEIPVSSQIWINPQAEEEFGQVVELIKAVRYLRSEMKVAPGKKGEAIVVCQANARKIFEANLDYILNLARLEKITFTERLTEKPARSAALVAGRTEVYLLLGDLIDIEKEVSRLEKELEASQKILERIKNKLANPDFLTKAAAEVVEFQKQESAKLENKIKVTRMNLENLRL